MTEKFFSLIRLGVGGDEEADKTINVSEEDWVILRKMAKKQSLEGILWDGMQCVNEESCPPHKMLIKWMAQIDSMEERNKLISNLCREISEKLEAAGMDACILKGQGVAELYPNPLHRQCGDIDVWCRLKGKKKGEGINRDVKEILSRIADIEGGRVGRAVYHHVEWSFPDVEVELHYRPQQMNHPLSNSRFQRWCAARWDEKEMVDGYWRPSVQFNMVFMLEHLYHHLLFEGVGLRQVADYYVLLRGAQPGAEVKKAIKDMKMQRFAGGMMWVLAEVFHLERERMVVEPDEEEGRFILDEMLAAGNFGHYDQRIDHARLAASAVGKFWVRTRHRWRFIARYPSEIIWDWPFRFYHWWWRKRWT